MGIISRIQLDPSSSVTHEIRAGFLNYIECSNTSTSRNVFTATLSGMEGYTNGMVLVAKFTMTTPPNNACTLNINNKGAIDIKALNDTNVYGILGNNKIFILVYDGICFKVVSSYYSDSNTVPSAYCSTAAATAAKAASCSGYALKENSYIHVLFTTTNTAASALTLNINSKGAKPIYINGTASSATNKDLPAGSYIAFYDGTKYHLRTDEVIPGTIENANRAKNADSADSVQWSGVSNKEVLSSSSHATTSEYVVKGSGYTGTGAGSKFLREDGTWQAVSGGTDTKVTQTAGTATSYTYWRPLLVGNSSSSSEGFTPTTNTDVTYAFNTITCQPSTGTIRASHFKIPSGTSSQFLKADGSVDSTAYTANTGTVTGPATSTANHVATFDGTDGKSIKDSGYTIGKSVPSNAVFTDTDTKVKQNSTTTSGTYKFLTTAASTTGTTTGEAYFSTTATVDLSTGYITARGFKVNGVTGAPFLKADGTIDNTAYVQGPTTTADGALAAFSGTSGAIIKQGPVFSTSGTRFLREDGTWQTVGGGSGTDENVRQEIVTSGSVEGQSYILTTPIGQSATATTTTRFSTSVSIDLANGVMTTNGYRVKEGIEQLDVLYASQSRQDGDIVVADGISSGKVRYVSSSTLFPTLSPSSHADGTGYLIEGAGTAANDKQFLAATGAWKTIHQAQAYSTSGATTGIVMPTAFARVDIKADEWADRAYEEISEVFSDTKADSVLPVIIDRSGRLYVPIPKEVRELMDSESFTSASK